MWLNDNFETNFGCYCEREMCFGKKKVVAVDLNYYDSGGNLSGAKKQGHQMEGPRRRVQELCEETQKRLECHERSQKIGKEIKRVA